MYLGDAEPVATPLAELLRQIEGGGLATTTFCRTTDGRQIMSPSPECAPLICPMCVIEPGSATPLSPCGRCASSGLRSILDDSVIVDRGHVRTPAEVFADSRRDAEMKAAHDASMPLLWRLGKMSLPSMAAASAVVGYAAYRGTGSKVGGGAAGIVSLVALVANQIKQNGWGIRF